MNSSIATLVLASALITGQNATPTWQTNYAKAQQMCASQQKPMAVVFGMGADGWKSVTREAGPNADAMKLLTEGYICVYVDASTPAGKALAQQFSITGTVGIVLSDRVGTTQAFWHQGDLSNQALTHYLKKYADPQITVRGTETATSSRTSSYPPNSSEINWEAVGSGSSYCPSCNNARRR